MNAAIDTRRLKLDAEFELLRDRLDVAIQQRDYWKGKNQTELEHWEGRIIALNLELNIHRSHLRLVMPGDGGPDEQRRLEAREDWKRERDEYA